MSELPKGWTTACLGEFGVEIRGSERPRAGTKYELYSVPTFPTGRPEILDGAEIGSNKRPVEEGDLLLCKINPRINRVWVVRTPSGIGPMLASTEYLVLRVPEANRNPLVSWLCWYLRSPEFRRWIELAVEGATGSHTRAKSGPILEQEVPIAPAAEQQRIVAAIEEHFSRLDAAESSLHDAQLRVAALKGAVFARSTRGEWPWVSLANVSKEQGYGSSAKARKDAVGGAPVLRMGNIQEGRICFNDLKYLPVGHPDVLKYELAAGDLLFNRTNSTELVGKSAVFKGAPHPMAFASYLIRVRLAETCEPDWAALVLNGPIGRRYVAQVRTQQVGQANVNGTKLAAMPIPLPDVEEQRKIVAEVERQLSVIDAMSAAIERAFRGTQALRRSILDRAFTGRLVPQDPTDEPAISLLEGVPGA